MAEETIPAPRLRLTSEDDQAPEVYRMERRTNGRRSVSGRVTAVSTEKSVEGNRNRICSLVLRDMSDTGVGVWSQEPLDPDTSVAIFLPPHGAERGFDLIGKVARCTQRDFGHEIGIRLEPRQAA
jgi:hypothetical protein